jgi:hypothetical protein
MRLKQWDRGLRQRPEYHAWIRLKGTEVDFSSLQG